MSFEQTPNTSNEQSKEKPPYPGWVLKNGIWRNPLEEENIKSIDENKKDSDTENPKIDDELRLTEKELKKLNNKEYLNPGDIEKKKDLEIKYNSLNKETKKESEIYQGPEKKKGEMDPLELHYKWGEVCDALKGNKDEIKVINDCLDKTPEELNVYLENNPEFSDEAKEWIKTNIEVEKEKIADFKKWEDKSVAGKEGAKKENKKETEKEGLEKEVTKRYYDELEKIEQMPDYTKKLKKRKTKKCFQLINDWKDLAYLDDYKGIQEIFSELDEPKPFTFIYNLKKAEMIDEVAIAMALNYKKWDIKDKKKLKTIKSFVNKGSEEKNFWYKSDDRDGTFKDIAQILALKDIPFKSSINVLVEDIKNPNIKSEAIAEIFEIEKETIEEKKKLLKEIKEKITEEKTPSEEETKKQFEKIGASPEIMGIFEKPELLSELFNKGSKILKNPEVQKNIQELQDSIKKATKEEEIIPDPVAKAAEFMKGGGKEKKKESLWKTSFGVMGWSILLFLVFFMLAELKGVDYLSGQTTGKKKEK